MLKVKKYFLSVLICLILLVSQIGALPGRASATGIIYRVSPAGSTNDTCGSESEPCATIQKAVNLASSGDIILVAGGTYSTAANKPECKSFTSELSIVCIVNEHLTIRGGYSISNWSITDPVANPTVIDGLNLYRGITLLGSSNITTLASLTLENITIQNGRASGNPTASGGGILVDKANVIIRNVVFQNNKSIGGSSSINSGGTSSGGGLTISDMPTNATGTLENLIFINNEARGGSYTGTGSNRGGLALGGGFYMWRGNITGSNLTVINNLAQGGHTTTGTGRDSSWMVAEAAGGGFSIHEGSAEISHILVSENSAIGGNSITYAGGGYGGGIELEMDSYLRISDSTIQNNHALGGNAQYAAMAGGGGFLWDRTTVILDRVRVIGNTVKGGTGTSERGSAVGGGIHAMRTAGATTISILNSIIADNSLEFGNGTGSAVFGAGGGMFIEGYPADIVHTTISGNRLSPEMYYGAGLIIKGMYSTPGIVNLTHSIVSNHVDNNPTGAQSALFAWTDGVFNLTRNLFSGNTLDTNINNNPSLPGGPGAFNGIATTLYASSAGYIAPGAPFYNYHLRQDSAAKDQATTSTVALDFELQSRPYAAVEDIGADEYFPFTLSVFSVASGALYLDWKSNIMGSYPLLSGVDHFEVIVACPAGANPPNQGSCGVPILAGTEAHFTLTGLSINMQYSVSVQAKNSSGATLANSVQSQGVPISMSSIFLPILRR